jgi:hypothetical protein
MSCSTAHTPLITPTQKPSDALFFMKIFYEKKNLVLRGDTRSKKPDLICCSDIPSFYFFMMKYPSKPMLTLAIITVIISYLGTYAYYRFYDDGGVINHITSDSYKTRNSTLSRSPSYYEDTTCRESFASASIVSSFSTFTGLPVAKIINRLYTPLRRIDYRFTGRFIKFSDVISGPIFSSGQLPPDTFTVDLNSVKEIREFEEFINYDYDSWKKNPKPPTENSPER